MPAQACQPWQSSPRLGEVRAPRQNATIRRMGNALISYYRRRKHTPAVASGSTPNLWAPESSRAERDAQPTPRPPGGVLAACRRGGVSRTNARGWARGKVGLLDRCLREGGLSEADQWEGVRAYGQVPVCSTSTCHPSARHGLASIRPGIQREFASPDLWSKRRAPLPIRLSATGATFCQASGPMHASQGKHLGELNSSLARVGHLCWRFGGGSRDVRWKAFA